MRTRRAPASRPRSATTCSTSWMRSGSSARLLAATTGAAAPPASWPRCGPSACAAWCDHRLQHPEHRRVRPARLRPRRSIATGTSGTSTPSAAAPGCSRTAATSAGCCGGSGRRTGSSTTRPSSATARFDNPDFVDVVIQSYRHRYGYAPGDPALEAIERRLAAQPPITVPTIMLHGDADGVGPAGNRAPPRHFTAAMAPRRAGRRTFPAARGAGRRRPGGARPAGYGAGAQTT